MSAPLLDVRDAHVTYRARGGLVTAVRGVTLSVARGERLGLVGESGCGKSSLARAMLGLERLSGGAITFDGQPVRGAPRALRRRFQPVFQDAGSALDPRMTVGASLLEPLEIHGIGTAKDRAVRVDALLDLVQLPRDVQARLPRALSAGQRQRVNIARALALEPELLILDEPVSALDVSVQAQVLNLLEAIAKARSLALVFISHDLDVVAHLCERVAVMYAGLLVELGPTADVLERPRHPYTEALCAARTRALAQAAAGEPPSPTRWPPGCAFHPRCPKAVERCGKERPALPSGPHRAACFVTDP
ncbi:MAG: ABC transporter ATP-binding protein [Myxococcota bacterium]